MGRLSMSVACDRSILSTGIEVTDSPPRMSLHASAAIEARRYKWIESQKAGRDLGEEAVRHWVREHWAGFLRTRWMEHLEGRVFWIELDRGNFGLLRERSWDPGVFDEILRRLRSGGENLDILCWSLDQHLSPGQIEEVLEILEALDINGHRVEPRIGPHLSVAG
jgi:hypothetical protein